MSYRGFLAELLMAECDDRSRRRSERRIKAAGFPRDKSLRTFDFDANPSIDPATIHTLAKCEWVQKGLPLCLIGDSGTGKTHLLIALGTEAAMAGYRVKYVLARSWSTNSSRPPTTNSSPKPSPATAAWTCSASTSWATWNWTNAEPNCCSRSSPNARKNLVAIASNESFSGWTKTFTDPRLCAAIVDRLYLRRPHHRNRHRPATASPRPAPEPATPPADNHTRVLPRQGSPPSFFLRTTPRTRESGVSSQQQKDPQDQQLVPQLTDNWIQNSTYRASRPLRRVPAVDRPGHLVVPMRRMRR